MKKIILSLLMACAAFLTYAQSFTQPTDATDCTNTFFKAILEKDSNTLTNVLANDFSLVSFQGRMIDRDLLINSVSKGYLSVETGIVSGIRTRNYNDVSVVTGSWYAKAKMENSGLQGELAFLAVCVRTGGNWKLATLQLTPVQ